MHGSISVRLDTPIPAVANAGVWRNADRRRRVPGNRIFEPDFLHAHGHIQAHSDAAALMALNYREGGMSAYR